MAAVLLQPRQAADVNNRRAEYQSPQTDHKRLQSKRMRQRGRERDRVWVWRENEWARGGGALIRFRLCFCVN